MIYRSKVDRYYKRFLMIIILILALATFWPLFLEGGNILEVIVVLGCIFGAITAFLLWCTLSIKYVFRQEDLLVSGGPFRSRIPYQSITKAAPTTAIYTGYRVMSAREGLEIFYTTAAFGSVKISPEEPEKFIDELKKRCPHMQVEA